MRFELGVIGGGNMAEAIVRAAIDHKIVEPEKIIVSDPLAQRRELFEELGVTAAEDNSAVIAASAQVMLAVKPQALDQIAGDLRSIDAEKQIVLSIMAGVSTRRIAGVIGRPARVVRIMPNTPLMAGAGMAAVAVGEHAREGDELLAMQVFQAAGEAIRVEEERMDAVTAVSGSGPAYVFYLAEAMTEAAESLGLEPHAAELLTQQTILGAAQLMRTSADPPGELRRRVTSPGGTTQAAIEHLESNRVQRRLVEAIRRAAQRSRELGG